MTWIKLTGFNDGQIAGYNMDKFMRCYWDAEYGRTFLEPNQYDEDIEYIVKETPEQILALIASHFP